MIITIDGPAGAGKSTAARALAGALGIACLDTGATYRAVTLKALRENTPLTDPAALAELARQADVRLDPDGTTPRVLLDGRDVSEEIRTPQVTANAHYLATPPEVRSVMVDLQRRLGTQLGSFVTEGRDQGTVVFPDADVKFYLEPDVETRARRRQEELVHAGHAADLEKVRRDIEQRDRRDRTRETGPLVQPPDAIVVDNAGMSPEETREHLLAHVRRVLA